MRTRFAPSPTGNLHLGGLRTALFNYVLAKQHKGQVVLRIEDTDQDRSIPGSVERICNDLKWCGIEFDEGPNVGGLRGPYIQSSRLAIYQKYARHLVNTKNAYYCNCSPGMHNDVECQSRLLSQGPVIRLKMPRNESIVLRDQTRGAIHFDSNLINDAVLIKSNGYPTYHLANVVDDHLMEISHVIRGEEWISSTPKHLFLYQCMGWTPPEFIHLPLLLNQEGGKMSKRQGDADVRSFKNKGFLPEALVNFVALLGCRHEKEFFTVDDLIETFAPSQLSSSPAVVSYDKLHHLNKLHMHRKLETGQIPSWIKQEYPFEDTEYIKTVLHAISVRASTLVELTQCARPFFVDPQPLTLDTEVAKAFLDAMTVYPEWDRDSIRNCCYNVANALGVKIKRVTTGIRSMVMGTKEGIELTTCLHLLGSIKVRQRLLNCIKS